MKNSWGKSKNVHLRALYYLLCFVGVAIVFVGGIAIVGLGGIYLLDHPIWFIPLAIIVIYTISHFAIKHEKKDKEEAELWD